MKVWIKLVRWSATSASVLKWNCNGHSKTRKIFFRHNDNNLNQGQWFTFPGFCYSAAAAVGQYFVAYTHSTTMAVRQQNSRKVASLIIFLAFWFLISSSDLRQILGTILVPLLTPKSQIRVSELNTKTVAKTEHGMTIIILCILVLWICFLMWCDVVLWCCGEGVGPKGSGLNPDPVNGIISSKIMT